MSIQEHPKPQDLAAFIATLEEGSLTAGARALGLPKSTVSRRLARLEARLGARLFERVRGGLRLTDVGRLALSHARDVMSSLDELVARVEGAQAEPVGPLRVSVSSDLAGLDALWIGFCQRYPRVDLQARFSNHYVDVASEGFHLALRGGRGEEASLIARRVGDYALWAVAAPGYLEARAPAEGPEDLEAWRWIALKPPPRDGAVPGVGPRSHVIVLSDLWATHRAALAGLGVAYLPAYLCAPEVARGALRLALPEGGRLAVPVYAVYPDRRYLAAPQRAFIEHASGVLGAALDVPPRG